jgi:hypothetical protein
MSRVIGSKDRAEEYIPEPPPTSAPPPPIVVEEPVVEQTVTLDLTGLPEGAEVELDGRPLPQLPILLPGDDDDHVLKVVAAGYEPWEADVTLLEDVLLEVEMTPLPTSAGPKKGKKTLSEPPIDTTYPGMVGKKKGK